MSFPFPAVPPSSSTVSFIASATSTVPTITVPADVQSGDLLVLFDLGETLVIPPTAVLPTGFTQIIETTITDEPIGSRAILSYKIADGTESSTTLTGMDGSQYEGKVLLQFRNTYLIQSVVPNSAQGEGTVLNPAAQTVLSSAGSIPLIVLGSYVSGGPVDPRSMTPAKDGEANPDVYTYLAYKIYNSDPSDVVVDMDDEGANNILQSCYLAIS